MNLDTEKLDYAIMKDGRVLYGDDPTPPGGDGQDDGAGDGNPVETELKRSLNDVETEFKPSLNDAETELKPKNQEQNTMAIFAKWLRTLRRDKLREELDNNREFTRELADGKTVKRLTYGIYTLETLPRTKNTELCNYAMKKYGLDWNKVRELVMITRIFKRFSLGTVVLINVIWITITAIVYFSISPKAEVAASLPKKAHRTALAGSARRADSLWIKAYADSKCITLYGCRYDSLLCDQFHAASNDVRMRMIDEQYRHQMAAVAKQKKK